MKLIILILSSIACLSSVPGAYALSTDRDQPANIEADDIEFDFRKGTRTYINNVLVVQGTLRLKADKLQAIYEDSELSTATAWGSLARFKQRPDGKQHDVEGWAKKIVVDQKKNTLTLIGKAALKQGADTARGETIVYNMTSDTLSVKGGANMGAGGKSGQSQPKRTIEDPFKDDAQGPPPVGIKKTPATAKSATAKSATAKSATAESATAESATAESATAESATAESATDETEQQTEKPEVEFTRSGRSRLIITPK